MNKQPNIVIIGGGTGSFTLLSGLKRYTSNLTALVNISNDGDSAGILMDELGILPAGDIRQCLVALSNTQKVRDLFTYRFDEGAFDGHSFGNLFISVVEKMSDSFEEAIEVASDVLRITGRVIPITLDKIVVTTNASSGTRPKLKNRAVISDNARQAILDADVVVIAPGNVYGTLAPALIVNGVGQALKKTKASVVQVTNLVTKPNQTNDFTVTDYADEIERFCGVGEILDYVIFNTDEPTKQMRDKYVRDGEYMLEFDLDSMHAKHYRAVGLPLIDKTPVEIDKNDKIAHVRSLIRHDSDAVAREIMKIYFS